MSTQSDANLAAQASIVRTSEMLQRHRDLVVDESVDVDSLLRPRSHE
jgi:hypothetical protein